jgi:hypothetical protein
MFPNIVLIPTQGFGNRLRAIASSFILAEYMHVKFFMNWEKEECCNVDIHDIFLTQFDSIKLNEIDNYFFNPSLHTNVILDKISTINNIDYLVIQGGHEFKHFNMSENDFIKKKHTFYKSLIFNDNISNYVSNFNLPKHTIGIHFRDFISKYDLLDGLDFSKESPIDLFILEIKRILQSKPNTKFFLSSNSKFPYQFIKDIINKDNLLTTTFDDISRNSTQGIQHCVADFLLLSNCKYIIGTSSSSFSDESCFFNLITKHCISKKISNIYHCYGLSINYNKAFLLFNSSIYLSL